MKFINNKILIYSIPILLFTGCSYNNVSNVNNINYTFSYDVRKEEVLSNNHIDDKNTAKVNNKKEVETQTKKTPSVIIKNNLPVNCVPIKDIKFQKDPGISQNELDSLKSMSNEKIIYTLLKQLKTSNQINNSNIQMFEEIIKKHNAKCFPR